MHLETENNRGWRVETDVELIVAPQRGYDEPAILSYAISSFCPTSADGLQFAKFRKSFRGL